ncbi:MAG: Verru/Chthon cassette protein A, partial [Verrucomicrobiia bacterium]
PVTSAEHPGAGSPPDHLIADFLWMPRVDPVPISENFSTAGKVNLNTRIQPFGTYITRDTAVRSALKHLRIRAIPDNQVNEGHRRIWDKLEQISTLSGTIHPLDLDATMAQINQRLVAGQVYRSATEICEVPLIPVGGTNVRTWWNQRRYTADNLRERPYAYLYPLLTTKSNTYRVHWRVQALERPRSPGQWNQNQDRVLSEFRGSTLIERYLDPSDTTIPDYATNPGAEPLHNFYRWRVVSTSQFNP